MNMNSGKVFTFCSVLYKAMLRRCVSMPIAKNLLVKLSTISQPKNLRLFAATIPSMITVNALTGKNKKTLIKEADDLYDANKFVALYDTLEPHKGSKEPEILWRLARALFEKCRDMSGNDKLRVLEDALALVDEALELDDNCWAAHKWRAILLDYVWRYKSTKGRIIQSFEVRKHMERAISLNPKDSTSYYLLGEWCFTFADMPWYQRKVAATIFASPPTSTYQEALKYFEKAEENSPLFYSMNLLMLAKCHLGLNNQEKAVEYLKKTINYPIKTADDQQAYNEAEKLLKGLKVG